MRLSMKSWNTFLAATFAVTALMTVAASYLSAPSFSQTVGHHPTAGISQAPYQG